MRARKTDSNQTEVVKALRKMGVSVFVTSGVGDSFVDIVVGHRGVNYLMEIKDGKATNRQRKLRPGQQSFFDNWKGKVYKIESVSEAVEILFGNN